MEQLDEADASFGQPSGQQAVGCKRPVAALGAVEIQHVLGFIGDVDQLGNAGLHPECQLVLADPGRDLEGSRSSTLIAFPAGPLSHPFGDVDEFCVETFRGRLSHWVLRRWNTQ